MEILISEAKIENTKTLETTFDIVIKDRLGKEAYKGQHTLSEFCKDEWHEFDYNSRSYELNMLIGDGCLAVHMYNYGDTVDPNSIIAVGSIEDNYTEDAAEVAGANCFID